MRSSLSSNQTPSSQHKVKQHNRKPKAEDYITLKELEHLSKCPIEKLKSGSLKIIIERAMAEPHLTFILNCAQSKYGETRKKAFIALHQLSQHEANKSILVKRKVLKILAKSLKFETDEITNRHSVACLYQLVVDHDKRKAKLCGYNAVEYLTRLLGEYPDRYNDLKYWIVCLLHQLCLTESVSNYLIDAKVIYQMVEVSMLTFGNPSMQKLCFHSIVRLLSNFEEDHATDVLNELADMSLISLAAACLRNNDSELAQWTLFLIHEFAIRNVRIEEIIKIKGLLKVMIPFVENNENIIPRIILRTLKTICEKKTSFYKELNKFKIVTKILKCLAGSDEQAQYWSLSLLHILVYQMGDHREFFEGNGLNTLLKLASSKLVHVRMYVVEILSVLCADPSSVTSFESSSSFLMETVLGYLTSSEPELRHSACSLLVSFLAISRVLTDTFVETEGVFRLSRLFLGDDSPESLRPVVCKALSCLVNTEKSLKVEILVNAIIPGLYLMFQTTEDLIEMFSDNSKEELHFLVSTRKDQRSNSVASLAAPTTADFPRLSSYDNEAKLTLKLCSMLECLGVLFTAEMTQGCNAPNSTSFPYIEDLCDDVGRAIINSLSFPLLDSKLDELSDHYSELLQMRQDCAIHGLRFLHSVMIIKPIKASLVQNSLLDVLQKLLFDNGDLLTKEVIMTFSLMISIGGFSRETFDASLYRKLLKACLIVKADDVWPYFSMFSRHLCDGSSKIAPNYVMLEKRADTHAMDIFGDELAVSNRLWTFESAFGSHGVHLHGKFAYEFHLGTPGVVQIGWASDFSNFNEFGGWGVGDYRDSYSFDGSRVRKWNGRDVDEDSYGVRWNGNDTVTCLLDLDEGTISFMLNGLSLGIAFRNVDTRRKWFPAVSMTGGQWGRFRFGSDLDPLQFCPEKYDPISSVIVPKSRELLEGSLDIPLSLYPSLSVKVSPIGLFSFYYEARLGLDTFSSMKSNSCMQFGCMSNTGTVICMAYNRLALTLSFLRFPFDGTSAENFDSLVELSSALIKDSNDPAENEIDVIDVQHGSLEEAITLGVGVTSRMLFFTLNGKRFGPTNLCFDEPAELFIPYFRNIPRFLLNLGQFDFVNQDANELYSP